MIIVFFRVRSIRVVTYVMVMVVIVKTHSFEKMLQTKHLTAMRTLQNTFVGAVLLACVATREVELVSFGHSRWQASPELIY